MNVSKKPSRKSRKKPDLPRSKTQAQEKAEIEHAIYGFDFNNPMKGVEIKSGRGIKDMNPEVTKGVEIYDPRHGKG